MKNMTLEHLADICHGTYIGSEADKKKEIAGAVIDSRLVEKDYLFIAVRGEKVDGHSFIPSVFEKGALAVLSEKKLEHPAGAYILVESTLTAMKEIAADYRRQLAIKVVGITGSVGKTSTKEFIAATLATHYQVLKTEGNFNNEIGLPLTVLRIRDNIQVAVLEMGISDFGEMHRLSSIAQPDVCVITNIGQCHLENLGTRDGILKAKTEIFDFMQPDGKVCLNGDDDKLMTVTEVHGKRPLFFGKDSKNEIYATDYVNQGLAGSTANIHREGRTFGVKIPLPGEHMVYNALAATAVATVMGLSDEEIAGGISSVEPVGGRSHVIHEDKVTIIDDCYNANPVSMKAAIDLLSMANTRKVAILGDMFELGNNEKALHEEVGTYAAYHKIDCVICVGNLCRYMYDGVKAVESDSRAYYFEDRDIMLEHLGEILHTGDTVLVKASHGMHFEEVVKQIPQILA